MSTGSWATPGTFADTRTARTRLSASRMADRASTHQCGRRSKTRSSPSLRSRRGKGSSCSWCGQGVLGLVVPLCTVVDVHGVPTTWSTHVVVWVVAVCDDVVVRPKLDVLLV